MKRVVEILVTIRRPELREMAVLTLRTLRVGFPTAHLVVWGNDLGPADAAFVAQRAAQAGGVTWAGCHVSSV